MKVSNWVSEHKYEVLNVLIISAFKLSFKNYDDGHNIAFNGKLHSEYSNEGSTLEIRTLKFYILILM